MVGLHVSCIRIGTKIFGPAIPSRTSGKSVSCQQMHFGRPDGSHFPASSVFWCCCFIGCVLCRWASYHVQGTYTNFGSPLSQILPIHRGASAGHWLDTWLALGFAHFERTCSTFCWHRKDTQLVPNLLWCVLETGCSHCQTSHSSLDTKSFALATCGAKAAWAAKTPLGQQTGDVLSLPRIGSLGRHCARLWAVEATIEWFIRFLQGACNVWIKWKLSAAARRTGLTDWLTDHVLVHSH